MILSFDYCPPAKEGGERSERVVVLWFRNSNLVVIPKNNHPMPSAFPLLRRRGVLASQYLNNFYPLFADALF